MTTISLDRNALFALIDADPDFSLSLKQSVMAEVTRRMFEKDSAKIIAAAEPALFKAAATEFQKTHDIGEAIKKAIDKSVIVRGSWGTTGLSDDAKAAIEKGKIAALSNIGTSVEVTIAQKFREIMDSGEIEAIVERRVKAVLNVEIEKMAKELLASKLAAAKAALS